jgi:branched-chain amino acid transport system permease protein
VARTALRLVGLVVLAGLLYGISTFISDRTRFNPVYYRMLMEIGRFIVLAVSLTLINGITGQFSLGHAAFMAVGGYVAGVVTYYAAPHFLGLPPPAREGFPLAWQLWFLLSLIAGGVGAALVGFLVGLPSLRLRGDYLAIVTLGMGEVVRVVIQHIQVVGGAQGFTGLPQMTTFFWIWMVAILTIIAVANLKFSAHGRALLAIREDEVAAEAMGVPITRYKVSAFVIGSFFAGTAGGLYAHQVGSIYPTAAQFDVSILIVTMVVLGGTGSITGSVIAAAVLTALPEVLREFAPPPLRPAVEQYRMVIFALLLIVLMLTRPQGLFGAKEIDLRGLFARRRKEIGAGLE